jgi:TetR/AcrR family acrAB operon transcriptional repressor
MAVNGAKSANPSMQPADAFLRDLKIMMRTLVAGAVGPSLRRRVVKSAAAKKSPRRKPGDRK